MALRPARSSQDNRPHGTAAPAYNPPAMSSLVILLPTQLAGPATEYAYVLTPDGRTVGSHGSAPPALLPRPAGAGAEVVAVVPVGALSWHQVHLPKGTSGGSPRLRAVLEGLLEE